MRRARSVLVALTVLFLVSGKAAFSQCGESVFDFLCAGGDSTDILPFSSHLDEPIRVLVIFSAGGADCPAVDGRNYLKPWWADEILDPAWETSASGYYDDNSLGQFHLVGTVAAVEGLDILSCVSYL